MRHSALVYFSIFSLAVVAPSSLASTAYSVGALGALGSGASAISAGSVGFYTSSAGTETPAIFSQSGLTSLSGVGIASGRNGNGVVVGTTYADNNPSVTRWVSGQIQTSGLSGYGNAINDKGQIGGAYLPGDGSLHAFIQTGTTILDLGGLGGRWSSVTALNASAQAAGTATTSAGVFRSFLWDGYGMRDLGTLGGSNSYGTSVSNNGKIAGASQTVSGYLNAFLWSGTGLIDLGTLGGTTSAAYGVNDSGQVVGFSTITDNTSSHGFVESGGVMLDLNSLLPLGSAWTITGAYAINDQGDILGTATENGDQYAVELKLNGPSAVTAAAVGAPEPAAMALAGVGFLVIALLGRRKRAEVRIRADRER